MENVKEMKAEDILKEMNKLRNKNVYSIYIPSLKKEVMFTEMSTGQEKSIVKCIMDNEIHNTEFIFTIRNIIRENCVEDIDIDSLTLMDKGIICLTMRYKSIGDEYIQYKNGKEYKISISKVIEKFKDIKIPEDKLIEDDDFDVICSIPTIKTEYEVEEKFKSRYIEDANHSREFMVEIENLFDSEIIKYIKVIKIKKDDAVYNISMEEYDYDDRVKFANALSNKILVKILKYVEEYKTEFSKALTVLAENLNETVEVEISRDFFIIQ